MRASESSSMVSEAAHLIGWLIPRKIITETHGDKIDGNLHGALLVLANLSLAFCTILYSKE